MNPFSTLRQFFRNSVRSAELLAEIREGIANSADQSAQRLVEIREGIANSAGMWRRGSAEISNGIASSADRTAQEARHQFI